MTQTKRRIPVILVAVIGLLIVAAAGVAAQAGTQPEEEPNDEIENATTIEVDENSVTVTGELHPNGDFDFFNFTLQEGQAVNVTVSASENLNREIPITFMKRVDGLVVTEYTTPFHFVEPGGSTMYTIDGNYSFVQNISGRYTLQLLPVDPSSPLGMDKQANATGSYTITIEPLGSGDEPSTETQSQLPNTLSIRSTGDERVYYNVTVSESIALGSGADVAGAKHPDKVSDTTASGSTALGGVDTFTFAGELTALSLDGGPAKVYINGEQVDLSKYQSTVTPTATSTSTPTATSTSTPTATAIPTSTETFNPTTSSLLSTTSVQPSRATTMLTSTPSESPTTTTVTANEPQKGRLLQTTAESSTDSESGVFGPGFGIGGIVVAISAIVAIGLFSHRRQ